MTSNELVAVVGTQDTRKPSWWSTGGQPFKKVKTWFGDRISYIPQKQHGEGKDKRSIIGRPYPGKWWASGSNSPAISFLIYKVRMLGGKIVSIMFFISFCNFLKLFYTLAYLKASKLQAQNNRSWKFIIDILWHQCLWHILHTGEMGSLCSINF